MKTILLTPLIAATLQFSACFSLAQTDDFNDGVLDGWTCFDPIGMALSGTYATCTPDSGRVVLSCPASPLPSLVGPARGGFLQNDALADYCAMMDFVDWDQSNHNLAFGMLGRVQPNPTPGNVDGYGLTYQVDQQNVQIVRIDNEEPTTLAEVSVTLDPQKDYRFLFVAEGSVLKGYVFELPNLIWPQAAVFADDGTYSSGMCGAVIFDQTSASFTQQSAGVTLDNFTAADVLLDPDLVIEVHTGDLEVALNWPADALCYRLQKSDDLIQWQDELFMSVAEINGRMYGTDALDPDGQHFYRLKLRD